MKRQIAVLLSVCLLLNACGNSRIERAGSGAAIGAGVGVTSGFLCCNAGDGAQNGLIIGVVLGALIGYIIDEPLFFNSHNR